MNSEELKDAAQFVPVRFHKAGSNWGDGIIPYDFFRCYIGGGWFVLSVDDARESPRNERAFQGLKLYAKNREAIWWQVDNLLKGMGLGKFQMVTNWRKYEPSMEGDPMSLSSRRRSSSVLL